MPVQGLERFDFLTSVDIHELVGQWPALVECAEGDDGISARLPVDAYPGVAMPNATCDRKRCALVLVERDVKEQAVIR